MVGVVMSRQGWPLAYEVYRGNQADVTMVESLIKLVQGRLSLGRVILVLDRGFTSQDNVAAIVESELDYIVGVRLRRVKEIREEVLTQTGPYQEVKENFQGEGSEGRCEALHRLFESGGSDSGQTGANEDAGRVERTAERTRGQVVIG